MDQNARARVRIIFLASRVRDFSIGYSQLDDLVHYIDNQEAHHKTKSFQDEYRELLREYNVTFDERYVWD